jgi:magnesium transporter
MKNKNDTASKILITKVPLVDISKSIGEAQEYLFKNIKKFTSVHYIYIIDKSRHLKGILSIHELLKHHVKVKISDVMHRNVYVAHPGTDQEAVAHLALKYDIVAVPIVDKYGIFIGAVPSEKILSVMYKETREDLLKISGVHHPGDGTDDIMRMSPFRSLKHRLPWLILGLIGGMLAAQIVGVFENTLEKNIILAAFIPLIVYMGDAVGTQMEAFIIRDYALNPAIQFVKYFFKHLIVVLMIGVLTSIALFGFATIFYHNVQISNVLSIALFIAILSSMTTGLIVPFIFTKFKQDPANASGPVATIIQDILSVTIYFTIATVLL